MDLYAIDPFSGNARDLVILGAIALGVAEFLYLAWTHRYQFVAAEWVANVLTHLGVHYTRSFTLATRVGVLAVAYGLTPLRVEPTIANIVLGFLLIDFLFYWKHRCLHTFEPLWALHITHHSSTELNLSTALRSNWIQRNVDEVVFFSPLAFLGYDPMTVIVLGSVNLASQYWCHTCVIGKLGPLEGIINTPSAHRMHHAIVSSHRHGNYGSFLMIWDRLFGTYHPETQRPELGTTEGFIGHNVLRHQFGSVLSYVLGRSATRRSRT